MCNEHSSCCFFSLSPTIASKTEKSSIFVKDNYALKQSHHYGTKEIEDEFAYGFYASQKYPDLFVRHLAMTKERIIFMERCEGEFGQTFVE